MLVTAYGEADHWSMEATVVLWGEEEEGKERLAKVASESMLMPLLPLPIPISWRVGQFLLFEGQ